MSTEYDRVKAMKTSKRILKVQPDEARRECHAEVLANLGVSRDQLMAFYEADDKFHVMSPEQLKELERHGWVLGAHGLTHRTLSMLPASEVEEEIVESKRLLEKLLTHKTDIFAYPYGEETHVGALAPEVCKLAGLRWAFSTIEGNNVTVEHDYLLKRIDYKRFIRHYL